MSAPLVGFIFGAVRFCNTTETSWVSDRILVECITWPTSSNSYSAQRYGPVSNELERNAPLESFATPSCIGTVSQLPICRYHVKALALRRSKLGYVNWGMRYIHFYGKVELGRFDLDVQSTRVRLASTRFDNYLPRADVRSYSHSVLPTCSLVRKLQSIKMLII